MSEDERHTPDGIGEPTTPAVSNADVEGSTAERFQAPADNRGEGSESQDELEDISRIDPLIGSTGGGVDGGPAVLRPGQPVRHVGRRPTHPSTRDERKVVVGDDGSVAAGGRDDTTDFDVLPPRPEDLDESKAKRAERLIALWFLVSAVSSVAFMLIYVFGDLHAPDYGALQNVGLGSSLALALFGIGAAIVLWAKRLMPKETAVQDRHDFFSDPAEQAEAEKAFFAGVDKSGIGRRPLLRNTMGFALTAFGIAPLFLLWDMGPAPRTKLFRTPWKKGTRLINVNTLQPVRVGDLREGGLMTVMPEGFDELDHTDIATASTILIRLRPEEDRPVKGRGNWSVHGLVAYSAICTHAGCPVKLYEQHTHHLLCPCHQSTFDVSNGCKVIFGPAARPLPQLPITVDDDGYLVARDSYQEPVGPSFWERG